MGSERLFWANRRNGSQETSLMAFTEREPKDHVGMRPEIRQTRVPILVLLGEVLSFVDLHCLMSRPKRTTLCWKDCVS